MDDFLYCGSTSDSSGNGSPPHVDCTNDVEKEISTYRAEEQIVEIKTPWNGGGNMSIALRHFPN